jgi:hypothetical protein
MTQNEIDKIFKRYDELIRIPFKIMTDAEMLEFDGLVDKVKVIQSKDKSKGKGGGK